MNAENKYQPLFHHLRQQGDDEVTLSFAEIEVLLGTKLPPSGRTSRGWWSNRTKGAHQATAWIEAGYRVTRINLEAEQVTFRKRRVPYKVQRKGDTILWNSELIRAMREQLGLSQVELAAKLNVRQQTISEWENDAYLPRRSTSKLLTMIAEQAGFKYGQEGQISQLDRHVGKHAGEME
jgi:DNA-binding transcriptional regulator YiaG